VDTPANEIAFLLGLAPDHLFDLVTQITRALGAPPPLRYGAYEIFEARATLVEAARRLLGVPFLPFFDLAHADVAFSFGANFLETYLSPVAYGRGFANMRRGQAGRSGYLIQFEPVLSQTGASANEWIPIKPGSEGFLAQALGRLVAEARGGAIPNAFALVDVASAAEAADVSEETLRRLARLFSEADHPLAIPGGSALGQSNGLETGQIILALNALVGNHGKKGGVYQTPSLPVSEDANPLANTLVDIYELVERMRSGKIKALLIHGANPVFELPDALGFKQALENVPLVISFSSFPDETAVQSDYIFPDHTALESWGYQKVSTGGDRPVISGAQPVVTPIYDTRATSDVLLAVLQSAGGTLAEAVPYKDEVEFIQQSMLDLVKEKGFFVAPEIRTFMAKFQQYGGWWAGDPNLVAPDTQDPLSQPLRAATPEFDGEGEYFLFPFMSPILKDGSGANKPWLQETPDPMTTVMWGSWVQINPETADKLGLVDDEVVLITSPAGSVEAVVYRYPAIRPDTIAMPFGQGHTTYGRYAQNRGVNPVSLFGLKLNGAGDLAFGANKVTIQKTGKTYKLARLESRIGVYGDSLKA
jgi:anaerobic selenocysteine-containing dehydrogenase